MWRNLRRPHSALGARSRWSNPENLELPSVGELIPSRKRGVESWWAQWAARSFDVSFLGHLVDWQGRQPGICRMLPWESLEKRKECFCQRAQKLWVYLFWSRYIFTVSLGDWLRVKQPLPSGHMYRVQRVQTTGFVLFTHKRPLFCC